MKLTAAGVSIVAISVPSFAFVLSAAAAIAGGVLRVDITSPVDGGRQSWNSQAPYAVTASYDGKSTKFGEIPRNDVVIRASYVADADSPTARRGTELPDALVEISQSNCTGCHDFNASSTGPSFAAIGKRYAGQANAVPKLAAHIRGGSHGDWGGGSMPPHPDLSPAQASAIAQWIASLVRDPGVQYSIGNTGSFRMMPVGKPGPHSGVVLSAFYTGTVKGGESRAGIGRSLVVVYGS